MLIRLLDTLSKHPELVMDTEKLDPGLRIEVERLKQIPSIKKLFIEMGINRDVEL